MAETKTIKEKTVELIDALKATCQTYGMGNDGNEYKIITQVFLYKFLNDKFGYEVKKVSPALKNAEKWELTYAEMPEDDKLDIFDTLSSDIPRLYPEHLIANLWNQQAKGDFDLIFDSTMTDIADKNIDIFSTQTAQNTKIPLFEKLTQYVTDDAARAQFARALVDKLVNFSFEEAFEQHYDFFADIFEYLIKDYNTAGGGKYAEYYTPHAIATIMARLLVGKATDLHNIECYDPSAGTGTLLMALAHQIGEDKCTIFAQDISQRSNKMLKLNLILNGLVSSLDHAIQGDTLVAPYHKSDNGTELRTFDYVVSNPPFKMDFSDTRERIAAMPVRFWAGVPKVPAKKKESMAIYTLFIQHVLNSLKAKSKLWDAETLCITIAANIAETALLAYPMCFPDSVVGFKAYKEVSSEKFMYYVFDFIRNSIQNAASGSTQDNINIDYLTSLDFKVPDKIAQDKMVELLSAIDEKILMNSKINDNLASMAYDIYMHTFFSKKPNGKLKDILIEADKSSVQVGEAKQSTGEYPFFTSGSAILKWDIPFINGRNCFLNTGGNADVKFYVGEAAYSTDTWCISTNNNMSDYLYLLLVSIKPELNQKFFQGTGLKHLQKPLLKDRPIYIPDFEKLKTFNEQVNPMFNIISENTRENQALITLRDWLLPMLMNGQATISD